MATSTTTRKRSTGSSSRSRSTTSSGGQAAKDNVDAAADRIRDLNERILESSKKAGNVYVDMYERTLNSIADYQEKVGQQSQVDWVETMADAQADFTRQLTKAFTSASRSALK